MTSLEDARGALQSLVPDVSLKAGAVSSEAVAAIGGYVAGLVGDARDPRIRTAMMQVRRERMCVCLCVCGCVCGCVDTSPN